MLKPKIKLACATGYSAVRCKETRHPDLNPPSENVIAAMPRVAVRNAGLRAKLQSCRAREPVSSADRIARAPAPSEQQHCNRQQNPGAARDVERERASRNVAPDCPRADSRRPIPPGSPDRRLPACVLAFPPGKQIRDKGRRNGNETWLRQSPPACAESAVRCKLCVNAVSSVSAAPEDGAKNDDAACASSDPPAAPQRARRTCKNRGRRW